MNNILVPYDFNPQSVLALDWSLQLAKKLHCNVTMLYVNELQGIISSVFSKEQDEEILEKIGEEMDTTAAKLSLGSGLDVEVRIQQGRVYSVILEVAAELQSSFIVMGSRSNDPDDHDQKPMVGRNTSRVIRMAKCPVISIGGTYLPDNCNSVLLPLDLTKETLQKTTWAITMAKIFGAGIRAVSALWSVNNPEIMARLILQMDKVKETIEAAGVRCTTHIIETTSGEKTAVPSILDYAAKEGDVGLMVIMTQQESALVEFFVGSHAQEFIRLSAIPVMSVVPEDKGA
ncbi:MAG: universal stress protein UspA-like protein [Bacteroidetes bacterium]|nr:MAG: universal stress protein UspA-like protein [Bacteroidota bacterium]